MDNWWEQGGVSPTPISDAMVTPEQKRAIDEDKIANEFYQNIGEHGESNHGFRPILTHDAKEKKRIPGDRSRDIGYGHKLTAEEERTGKIHGVNYWDKPMQEHMRNIGAETRGVDIALTQDNINMFLRKDMEEHLAGVKPTWEKELKAKGKKWSDIPHKYQLALTSLAYNVGVEGAKKFKSVLTAATDKNPQEFAKHMRRMDNKKRTAGMDNRVLKELYYAGIIKTRSEVAAQLPLSTANGAGVPK